MGSQKYDFAPIESAFINRCPIPGCVSPPCSENKGLPINANGKKNRMKCHVTRDHTGLRRELHIRVETRYGRVQHHKIPCIAATKVRKRYETHRNTKEVAKTVGPSLSDGEISTEEKRTARNKGYESAKEHRDEDRESSEEWYPGGVLEAEQLGSRAAEHQQRCCEIPDTNQIENQQNTQELPGVSADSDGVLSYQEAVEPPLGNEERCKRIAEIEEQERILQYRRQNKQTGRNNIYADTLSLSEMTQSSPEPRRENDATQETETSAVRITDAPENEGEVPAGRNDSGQPAGGRGHDQQTEMTNESFEIMLQALLETYATQVDAEIEEDHATLEEDRRRREEQNSQTRDSQPRPANHPMSGQCIINVNTLDITPPRGSLGAPQGVGEVLGDTNTACQLLQRPASPEG